MIPTLCESCGAKIVEYTFTLSSGLVDALAKLQKAGGGPININSIGLTQNQWTNFGKLFYWELVDKWFQNGIRAKGVWESTQLGWDFLSKGIALPERVTTFRNAVIRYEGDLITARDVIPGYQNWTSSPVVAL